MQALTVFISSTVKDFGPVRRDLKDWLEDQGIVVRASETDDFPVRDGVHSHDACLHAIDGCHLFVLLVGRRYGGRYADTPKSITWREYDEALSHRIPVVPLVLKEVNEKAEDWSRQRLREAPFGNDTNDLVAFIDHIRKGHPDNWMHAQWDGSFHGAKKIIQQRMNAHFVNQQEPHRELRASAERLNSYALARWMLDLTVEGVMRAQRSRSDAIDLVLKMVEDYREALFGFRAEDRWNIAVYEYQPTTDDLVVVGRRCDARIATSGRRWRRGQGHVGATWDKVATLVAADLSITSAWRDALPTDADNYRSAVATPIGMGLEQKWGVVVVTSSRLDHFRDADQIEVLTVQSLALFLERIAGEAA